MTKTPKNGDRTEILITRRDGTITARIPAYWVRGANGLIKVTVPKK